MNRTRLIYDIEGFKGNCSGRGCNRKPVRYLKIKYIKKIGKFCHTCAHDLLMNGLAEEITNSRDLEGDLGRK